MGFSLITIAIFIGIGISAAWFGSHLLGKKDNPELDGTDKAHPAWWRGRDAGALGAASNILDCIYDSNGIPPKVRSWQLQRALSALYELRQQRDDLLKKNEQLH